MNSDEAGQRKASLLADRRGFVLGVGGLAAGSVALGACAPTATSRQWAHEADVVVAGSGAAGLSAAIAAAQSGASVLVLEKGVAAGGTTSKSDGAIWVPNNHLMKIADPKPAAIAYMAHGSYPTKFRPRAAKLGLSDEEYALIEAYYDNAATTMKDLEAAGIMNWTAVALPDYQDHSPYNKASSGRIILPTKPDGSYGNGLELVRRLKSWLDSKNIAILLRHEVRSLIRNPRGDVIGVNVATGEGDIAIRARKGVIFGSGGYTQNPDLVLNFQPGPIFGGCAVPTNQGDFIRIGTEAGAKLGNMVHGWRAELVLEEALQSPSVPRDIWQVPGDSMIVVNKYGRRVVNEKRPYHDRTRVHFVWDSLEQEYMNMILFMVYDQRTMELFAGNFPLSDPAAKDPHVVSAATLPALAQALQARLDGLADKIGAVKLAPDFAASLSAQIERYNTDAKAGVDTQFGRDKYPWDDAYHTQFFSVARKGTKWPAASTSAPTLYPIDTAGPFHAILIGAGMLDTNGGPVIDAQARVLDGASKPIPGLFGAGNCIASPAGAAYWGAGATIGPAMTFGTMAGRNAAAEPVKQES